LRLAQCLINVSGKPEEALKLLAGLEAGRLSDTEARQRKLAEGDALLLQGKVPEATRCYESAGSLVSELNRTQNMRSRARLESARDYARRGEFGRAEILLQMIEWETPLDRLSMETGVARLQIYLSRKEYPRALTRCQQLLPLATVDTHRADLLYYLAEIQRGMGRVAEAQAALAKLVADYPYSEAAPNLKTESRNPKQEPMRQRDIFEELVGES
jgi:tetratricopeptide (TPR) repeat protein